MPECKLCGKEITEQEAAASIFDLRFLPGSDRQLSWRDAKFCAARFGPLCPGCLKKQKTLPADAKAAEDAFAGLIACAVERADSRGRQNRLLLLPAVGDNAAMQSAPPNADPPKRKRRCLQFRLRTLMMLTLLCAIGSAWVAQRMERSRQEREAVDAIRGIGGTVEYDYTGAEPPGPAWLRRVLGDNFFSEVIGVQLPGDYSLRLGFDGFGPSHGATDADLKCLSKLPNLRSLGLRATNITDDGLKELIGLTHLERLDLQHTDTGDAGLVAAGKASCPSRYNRGTAAAIETRREASVRWQWERRKQRQEALFITATDLPRSDGHPFYKKLNQLLAEAKFDEWIEQRCQQYYAQEEKQGQPEHSARSILSDADGRLFREH